MRILGGDLRGRALAAPPGRAFRPSSGRLRGAAFDILAHAPAAKGAPALAGARVLDAFAGTGAFGLEALSRGAAHAVFLDTDTRWVRRNLAALGRAADGTVIAADALRPPPATEPVNIAFLDPPYGSGLAAPALAALADVGWVVPRTLLLAETGAKERIAWPPGMRVRDSRRYGAGRLTILAVQPGGAAG